MSPKPANAEWHVAPSESETAVRYRVIHPKSKGDLIREIFEHLDSIEECTAILGETAKVGDEH